MKKGEKSIAFVICDQIPMEIDKSWRNVMSIHGAISDNPVADNRVHNIMMDFCIFGSLHLQDVRDR